MSGLVRKNPVKATVHKEVYLAERSNHELSPWLWAYVYASHFDRQPI